jgi:hypothetical protein
VLLDRRDIPRAGRRVSFLSAALGLGGEGDRCRLLLLRDVSRNVDRNAGSRRGAWAKEGLELFLRSLGGETVEGDVERALGEGGSFSSAALSRRKRDISE